MLIQMNMIDLNRPHMTVAQAVAQSGLSRSYFAYLLREQKLGGFRLGREWFIYTDSFQAFLASERKSGPKGPRTKKGQGSSPRSPDHCR